MAPSRAANFPPVHSMHVFSVKAPTCLENLPTSQVVHEEDPCVSLYLPASHSTHDEPPDVIEYVPAPQSLHRADPVDVLYAPAVHAVHSPPSSPDDPALQVQVLKAVLPGGELEFDGQAMHVELAEAPGAVEYVPAPQSEQVADPVNALYFPATHAEQVPPSGPLQPVLQVQLVKAALPTGELEFDGQAMHFELVEEPTAVEYVPAPQSEHRADPVDVLYFPATHAEQVPPSGPLQPVLQVQLVKAALPTGELEFDGQALHVELAEVPDAVEYVPAPQSEQVADVNALYFPATHAEHVPPPSGPVDPALQVQLVKAALPTGELEFDGQVLHVELDEDPTAVEYVPAPQSEQVADPVNALYFPATHAEHVSPSGMLRGPDEPALQVQLVKAELPAGELEFVGQLMHVEITVTAVEYVPAPQSTQLADPVDVLYFPATHGVHVPPLGPV